MIHVRVYNLQPSLPARLFEPRTHPKALPRPTLRRSDAPLHKLLPRSLDERPPREPTHIDINKDDIPRRARREPRRARRSGAVAVPDDRAELRGPRIEQPRRGLVDCCEHEICGEREAVARA